MSDITRIMVTQSKDDGDWDEWPYPTIETTSRVTGELKAKILKLTGRKDDDTSEVTIVEIHVSSGWSEFTQDDDYALEVFVGGERVKEWSYETSEASAMGSFLSWIDTK